MPNTTQTTESFNDLIMVDYGCKPALLMYGQNADMNAVARAVPEGYTPKWDRDFYLLRAECNGGGLWVCIPLWKRPVRRKR